MKQHSLLTRGVVGVALLALLGAGKPVSKDCAAHVAVLSRGAPLHGSNGLRFDSAGRLNVASVFGREIVAMDPRDGEILQRYTRANGIESPDDIAFGPDGALYWTAIASGDVGRRRTDGVFETVAHLPSGANSIGFSADGRLYVGLCIIGSGLFEIDPSGATPPRSIRAFPGERCGLNAFDVGADGLIYGPRFFAHEVVSIDPDSGDMQTVAGGFGVPAAAKFDANGNLWVVDTSLGQMWRVDVGTGAKRLIATIPVNTDNLAFDAGGRVYISSYDDSSIRRLLPNGSLRDVSRGGLSQSGGLALSRGRLFVADHYSLVELDAASGAERSVQRSVIGSSPLAEPMTVSLDGRNLILSSWTANAVQVWDPQSASVVESFRDFDIPMNAVGFRGGIAVAELGTGSVVLEREGERTTLIEDLIVPTGMAAHGSNLYVADWAAGTITRVTPRDRRVIARGLVGPEGLAWSAGNRLLVVEAGAGRVSEVDPDSGEQDVIADGLALGLPGIPGFPPTFFFNGIATDADKIYVTGDVDNVVYVISQGRH